MFCGGCFKEHGVGLSCECGTMFCPACYSEHPCPARNKPLWAHQQRALDMADAEIAAGGRAFCVVGPTGSGKTKIAQEFVTREKAKGTTFLIYTHRRMLAQQTSGVFEKGGVDHGVIMSGWNPALLRDVQVATFQTVNSWVERGKIELPNTDYVLVDEPHCCKGEVMSGLLSRHKEAGAIIIGTTATPVGLKNNFDKLLIIANTQELIGLGILVQAHAYSPCQPDLHKIKKTAVGEYSSGDVVKVMRLQQIVGNIIEWYRKLNPDQVPSVLFGPDVASTRWCLERFNEAGISAAGIFDDTPDDERQEIADKSKNGQIKVVGNRFVLREGVDWPWVKHCIFATAFGALSTYLQAGGRCMRAFEGFDRVVYQDHGGNYHRHGSLNQNVEWELNTTDSQLAQKRNREIQDGKKQEPIRCPKCGFERYSGNKCPHCGHEHKKSVRMIIQADGELKRQVGALVKRRRERSEEERQASGLFFAAANGRGMTCSQLDCIYFRKYGEPFPNAAFKLRGKDVCLPSRSSPDWDRKIGVLWPEAVRRKREAVA